MTVTTYAQWREAGSPWKISPWLVTFGELLRSKGYTVYYLGDESHLTANPPEDHTPFSHTPWPGSQPYPYVMAMDIMPGGAMDWRDLGVALVNARHIGVAGTEPIKYINYTTRSGEVLHTSWEPGQVTIPSQDSGHIHISVRTDRYTQTQIWNPWGEEDMALTDDDINKVAAAAAKALLGALVDNTATAAAAGGRNVAQILGDLANRRAVDVGEIPVTSLPDGPLKTFYTAVEQGLNDVTEPTAGDIARALIAELKPSA